MVLKPAKVIMINLQSMKAIKIILGVLILASTFSACKKDKDEATPAAPTLSNLEIGLGNNETAVIGKDFHFNADILAGDKIADVQIKILQRTGETYAKVWQHEIVWDQYAGVKNTNIHKHFDIPADAAEGKYDFIIIVNDQNGAKLELKKSLTLYTEANLPVNPGLSIFNIFANGARYYRNGKFIDSTLALKKGDLFNSQVTITNVKGDGKMYLLLINKKHNHRPESVDKIDLSKVIVYDMYEHKGWTATESFSNAVVDLSNNSVVRKFPDLTIGEEGKVWESGNYYFGVVYQNTTYNMGYYHYIEVPVTGL